MTGVMFLRLFHPISSIIRQAMGEIVVNMVGKNKIQNRRYGVTQIWGLQAHGAAVGARVAPPPQGASLIPQDDLAAPKNRSPVPRNQVNRMPARG